MLQEKLKKSRKSKDFLRRVLEKFAEGYIVIFVNCTSSELKKVETRFKEVIMKKVLFVPAMAFLAMVYFASCNPEVVVPTTPEEPKVYYTVTYTTEHGTAPETKTVLAGTVLREEDLPELDDESYFVFDG